MVYLTLFRIFDAFQECDTMADEKPLFMKY